MLTVGFSTGALAFGDFVRALDLLDRTQANAVELSALRSNELLRLTSVVPLDIEKLKKRYKYISFHAPTDIRDERNTIKLLSPIAEIGLNIVVHPDAIKDICLWKSLGRYVCIENMDTRKKAGRTAGELRLFFRYLPQARLCFDVAHARQVDPTMIEAGRILAEFGDRLAQVHASEVDGVGKHFPMSFGAGEAFSRFSSVISGVPIILESIVAGGAIDREIEKALQIFAPKCMALSA